MHLTSIVSIKEYYIIIITVYISHTIIIQCNTFCLYFNITGCTAAKPCVERYYNENSFVCVCNATYYDTIETFDDEDLQNGSYAHYESNMKDKRLHLTIEKFSTQEQANTRDQSKDNFVNY